MTTVITKLSDDIKTKLNTADEIWVAVALLSNEGLSFIQNSLIRSCKQNFLVGIDLPTDPKVLYKLYSAQLQNELNIKIYSQKECYHPKLYLIREQDKYTAFIGSANCTNGGLYNNIELSIRTDDQNSCNDILSWFSSLFLKSSILTKPFIDEYSKGYEARKNKKKDYEKTVRKEKKLLMKEFEIQLARREEFIKVLKRYRRRSDYDEIRNERNQVVSRIREIIDYPDFENIDVDHFFSIQQLGHIIAIPKPTIKREIIKFKSLLEMLCNENIDINIRIDRALTGNLKIKGVNIGLISKILVIHKPDLYFVKNGKVDTALSIYGILFPSGLTEGTRYKITCRYLRQVCIDTNIENLAVLDYYLYIEGGGE